ncbi:MAG: exopolysaccharide biosynthesis protein [Verrucomicrobia bacterium]|nr:exopolysaccharide biosynthesis protein [Verrucomicrobiota bacterium]
MKSGRRGDGVARQGAISSVVRRLEERLGHRGISIGELMHALEGKGHAAILAILAMPFCFPVQIPGLSTPFGIVLIFTGLRISFGQAPWLPGWLLVRKISPSTTEGLLEGLRKLAVPAEKILHPRLSILCRNIFLLRMHGLLVAFLAILLALPLPIPFSNLLAAIPILLVALALLEDDGFFMIAGYLAAVPCILFFGALYLLGPKAVSEIWSWIRHFWA